MFTLLLAHILTMYTLNMNGHNVSTDEYCNAVIQLHELDLERALTVTQSLVDADGNSETDYCF